MKIKETKKNTKLGINNKYTSLEDLKCKLLEEAVELSEAIGDIYKRGYNEEDTALLYGELYDTLLIILSMLNKIMQETSIEKGLEALKQHHKKLENRGWIFGGYWEISFVSENRRKAIQLSEEIINKKKLKYYNREVNDYIRKKRKNINSNGEV